jgi:hypothetical protein
MIAAASLTAIAAPAAAQVVPVTSVSTVALAGTPAPSGSLSVLTDGVFPADGSVYNGADMVSFDGQTSFRFDLGGSYSIDGLLATVDNNDNYLFSFFNHSALIGARQILSGEGTVTNGVETFSQSFAPIIADMVIVTGSGGDNRYGLGEVQFRSSALTAAVPEPATWAMMLLGFGGIGFAARRQWKAALQAA